MKVNGQNFQGVEGEDGRTPHWTERYEEFRILSRPGEDDKFHVLDGYSTLSSSYNYVHRNSSPRKLHNLTMNGTIECKTCDVQINSH